MLFSNVGVNQQKYSALASTCSDITYYSEKGWAKTNDLIDTVFSEHTFINSHDIIVSLNGFGTYGDPKAINNLNVSGHQDLIYMATGDNKNPNYFQIEFDKLVKVGKINFHIEAIDTITGLAVPFEVVTDTKIAWIGDEVVIDPERTVKRVTDNTPQIIDIGNRAISDIVILFDDINKNVQFTLKYFQITEYQNYEHLKWTTDYIEGADSKVQTVCLGTGDFTPNGNSNWDKSAYTSYSPTTDSVIDYTPIQTGFKRAYNYGVGNYISSYSDPWILKSKNYAGMGHKLSGFTSTGSGGSKSWKGYGKDGIEFPYLMSNSNDNTGVIIKAAPIYWSQNNYGGYYDKQTNSNFCNNATGSSRTPCYKYGGHSGNSRNNSYDASLTTYSNIVDIADRNVATVDYYLINEDTGNEKYMGSSGNNVNSVIMNETGRWRVKAKVIDLGGNQGTSTSNIFYIDNESPYGNFTPSGQVDPSPEDINLRFTPLDDHSGVKRYRYYISKDGGNTYGKPSEWYNYSLNTYVDINLNYSGEIKIKAEIEDIIGNVGTATSNVFNIQKSDVSVEGMISKSYEINELEMLFAKITLKDCKPEDIVEVEFYHNDILLDTQIVPTTADEHILNFSYLPNSINNAKLEIVVNHSADSSDKNNQLTLIVPEITKETKRTTGNNIEFKEVSATSITTGQSSQQNHYETLNLLLNPNKDGDNYFSGEAINTSVNVTYQNDCSAISDMKCLVGNSISSDRVIATFNNAAKPMDEQYAEGDLYKVPMLYNDTSKNYLLPYLYVENFNGSVYSFNQYNSLQEQSNVIEAGNRWFTNISSELGNYDYSMNGYDSGHNKFNWEFNQRYEITEMYYDQYRIRFSQYNDVDVSSNLWQGYEQWFKGLDENNPIYSETIEKVN